MGNVEIPKWLKGLPSAPEFYPTDTEFADPIAYISKIEKEASAYGICKVIPPFPKPSRKFVLHNLNKSLVKRPELGSDINSRPVSGDRGNDGEARAVFTTRQQELGQSTKKTKGAGNSQQPTAQKQVWQSGEIYTLEQFESKSKMFSRSVLSTVKEVSPLVTEALFWKAASEKPIYVEYANDVPGSAFGEANGLLNYLHGSKRRRRRIFSRENARRSDCRQEAPSNTKGAWGEETYTSSHHLWNQSSISDEGSANPSKSSTLQLPNQNASYPRHDMEGTSGWKLSNSPWNLQVIARSAGSLTRFMLDDIPGVTSPMIYIGMLFSWFAWHVEDHELHSLNFLHMGSPKTWYAVPADHAYAFEEVVRKHAYEGDLDRLATLTRLGEKTTLLSPEVVAASSIPCYRLVQNPGEFVVTFPRAYHVGFSHGFNCGEAANFGTQHWLEVAKEAAVRRAAMDHLPMLSHQQLLYLLTMSFVSRVPSSLLPGVRSSRLRDRLKEERELSVKKAFIEDMLKENKMLNILLRRDSAFYAVLWNPDLLPSNKGSMQHTEIATDISTNRKDEVSMLLKDDDGHNNLSNQTNLYMKIMNDLYFDDSDLSSNFQVDSGTLACVACGILGFPFMSLIQPSNKASKEILSADNHLCGGGVEVSGHVKSGSSNACNIHKVLTSGEVTKFDERWNTSCGFFRPRSFCLEHAVQVQALLQPKGGANVLVICHSDYEKIKGNAIALAQEIGCTFNYKEVVLGSAAVEDLNLINLAIDDEELNDCKEDWTTNLGINLRYCVKTRKDSPLKQIQHALKLVGLFSDASTSSISDIQWYSRKFRSKRAFVPQKLGKSWVSLYVKDKNVNSSTGRGKIILQYTRRKFKRMQVDSAEASGAIGSFMKHPAEIPAANSGDFCRILKDGLESVNTDAALSASAQINVQPEIGWPKACGRPGQESGYRESKTRKEAVEETKVEVHACTSTISESSQDNRFNAESSKNYGISHSNHSSCSPAVTADKSNVDKEADVTHEENSLDEVGRAGTPSSSSGESIKPADHASDSGDLTTSCPCEDVGDPIFEKPYLLPGVPDPIASDNQVLQATEGQIKEKEVASSCCKLGNLCTTNDGGQINIKAHTRQVDRKSAYDGSILADAKITPRNPFKRKRESVLQTRNQFICEGGYVRSPCEGLRPRSKKEKATSEVTLDHEVNGKFSAEKVKRPSGRSLSKVVSSKRSYRCNLDGCRMSFKTKTDLSLHMRNRCPYEECRKKFSNHRYALLHQRVHDKERPLKCTWKGCSMTFKWPWARTEHMRLHTGERPYECKIEGCGLTFRYVSDFSRHRRKTGHHVNPCS